MKRLRLVCLVLVLQICGAARAVQSTGFDEGPQVASVLVEKAARRMTLLDAAGHPVRVYDHIQLGRNPVGPKRFDGDGRTPEGHYTLDFGNPQSAYHLSLHISYPDSRDAAFAAEQGREPGGAIFLHGMPNGAISRPAGDWTEGCIAFGNAEIEQIWALVADGTPIDIRP